ncbi:hypothetical protein A9Q96_12330 [Rhodobacterales bacterium 52_120_T64]|nr:hypothetical protein A9Q96_12330 [Rhodobacterales bacterium 52_120_T64]
MQPTLDVCVDDRNGLEICVKHGIDRIELCSALPLGGLTPSPGLMRVASTVSIPTYAMIRPRAGNFCFSQSEVDVMLYDISAVIDNNMAGVVLGASTLDNKLDLNVLNQLCRASDGVGRTLHRVIDTVADALEAIDQTVDLGFERILSSGGSVNAMKGMEQLKSMQDYANGRIEIMAGSGVNIENAIEIMNSTGVRSLHSSCSISVAVPAAFSKLGFSGEIEPRTDVMTLVALKRVIEKSNPIR